MGICAPNLSFFLFLVEACDGSDDSRCWCSAVDIAAQALAGCKGPTSVFLTFGSNWDMVTFTGGSVFTFFSSSLAIGLALTKIVWVEFSGWMEDEFKPIKMMTVAGIVFCFLLDKSRMGLHKSKSAIDGSLIVVPNRSSTRVLPLFFEVLQCVISIVCRHAPNDTLRLGLHAAKSASLSELLSLRVH